MKTLIMVILTSIVTISNAQDGRSIVERYEKEMGATDQEATLTMRLISRNGNLRERTLTWSSRTDGDGRDASYIYFAAPADIRGSAFLTVENQLGQDDQWLYLPTLKRSRRISSSDKGKSFMGTDFTYQDIGNENSKESNYMLLRTDVIDGEEVFVIEATYNLPEKSRETGYSKRIIHIKSGNSMLVKTEFYGLDGKLMKVLECSDFEYLSDSRKWRPKTLHMNNLEKGTQTILLFTNYRINKGIDPNRFTIRHLESN